MRRLLGLLALLVLISAPGVARASVVFDASGNGAESAPPANPYTFSITLGAGTKGVMVHVTYYENSGAGLATINSISVGTTTLSLISGSSITSGSGVTHGETWGALTTLAGAQTVSITWSGPTPTALVGDAVSATGVDATTPINHGGGSQNATTPISLSMTSPAGDLTATMMYGPGGVSTPTTNQTSRWTSSTVNPAGGDRGPGTANPTHTWSGVIDWNLGGVITGANFQASGGGDVTPPTTPGVPAVSNVTSATVDLLWAASTDAVGVTAYDVQRALGTNSFVQIATPTSAATFTDTSLAASTQYTWRVRARDAAGNTSTFATSASTNTLNSTTRTLTWTPTPPLTQDSFEILRCVTTASTCVPQTIYTTTTASTYVDTSSGNPTSCYQVHAALAGTAGSGLSNIACATGGPIRLTITTSGAGSGTTSPPVGTTNFTNGSIVGLTATPSTPADFFGGWTGAADCTDGSVTLNSSTICDANFGRQIDTGTTFSYIATRGSTATRSLTNFISVVPTASVSKNNMLIVRVVTDNISTTSGQTGDHLKATDSQGNQYVKLGEQTKSLGSAGSGVTVSMWATRPFATITTANTVNVTLSTATIANAVTLQEYLLQASVTFTNATTTGTNGASASPSAVISGLSNVVHLFIAALGVEAPSTVASFTQSNNYASGTTTNGTVGSATTSNVSSFFGTRFISPSTGDTYAPALAIGTTPNWAMVFSALATAPSVNTHPLTLATQGTGNGTVTGGGTYYEGSVVQIQAFPDVNSQFAGWFTTLGSTCTSPTNPTVNVTVNLDTICTASFTTPNVVLPNRVLTVVTSGTGTGTTTGAGTYPNGTVVTLTATPAASSFFAGWTPAACSSGSVTLTADTTCTANFTLNPNATLTITNAGTGLGTTTGAGTYVQGANAVLTATPNVGSVFTGWSGSTGCTGSTSPLTLLMDSTKACVATFSLSTGVGPAGSIVPQAYKRCYVSYVLAVTQGQLPIRAVTWYVDNVLSISQTPGGMPTQNTAPFIFTKSLVKEGALVTANVTDSAGASSVFGPVAVACP